MNEAKKSFKLDCVIPASTLILEAIVFIVLVIVTAGLALPFCLFRIGRVLINNTEVIEK